MAGIVIVLLLTAAGLFVFGMFGPKNVRDGFRDAMRDDYKRHH